VGWLDRCQDSRRHIVYSFMHVYERVCVCDWECEYECGVVAIAYVARHYNAWQQERITGTITAKMWQKTSENK